MKPCITHEWDINERDALALQQSLSKQVVTHDTLGVVRWIAGVDVAYSKDSDTLVAAIVVLCADTLNVVETVIEASQARFPYIPGLFSFRELPPIVRAFENLTHNPDLVVCDGQGYAHPRRFGLACHLGVIFDLPSIGCGKTRLVGVSDEPKISRGAREPLIEQGEVVGSVLRTQDNVKPVYVSIGHRLSLETACDWVLRLSPKYRLPETTRQSDSAVRAALKSHSL